MNNTLYDEKKFAELGIKGISCVKKKAKLTFEAPFIINKTLINISGEAYFGAYSFFRGGRVSSLNKIGRFCSVAPGVVIGDGEHPISYLSTHQFQYGGKGFDFWPYFKEHKSNTKIEEGDLERRPPNIGNDVWIGANVFIGRGVSIGDGAVIAAGAVVVNDVPPYQIYGGVPAKLIKSRFDASLIEELLEVKWWNYELETLKGLPFRSAKNSLKLLKEKINNKEAKIFRPNLIVT